MTYPILAYGTSVLHQKAQPIPLGTSVQQLIGDMFETLQGANGLGLAAPQIGISQQLFIVDMGLLTAEEEATTLHPPFKKVYINPVLHRPEPIEWIEGEEGCLSIPQLYGPVKRSKTVRIEFFDANWRRQVEILEDMPARVVQHEYDHLEGKLYIDYLPTDKRMLLEPQLEKIITGKIKVRYPMCFSS